MFLLIESAITVIFCCNQLHCCSLYLSSVLQADICALAVHDNNRNLVFTNISSASPTSSLAPSKATGTSTCIGKQIEDSCIEASFPSETSYSGIQPPVCQKVDSASDDYLRVNSDKAKQAAADYCSTLSQDNVVLDAQASPLKPYSVPGAAENGGQWALSVLFDISGCPTDKCTNDAGFHEKNCHRISEQFLSGLFGSLYLGLYMA
ncbi:hypothetical protein ABVK25_000889 [Lepraria finkii]|uniref:Uncharacterized protein n=1 Tax=Lepraria finkii TaxID=1340010 RepID=A0ABR4BR85_9LECA